MTKRTVVVKDALLAALRRGAYMRLLPRPESASPPLRTRLLMERFAQESISESPS